VISDHGIRTMLTENFEEGLRPNVGGWIDDNLALINPWGFDPAAIAVDVQLWHGTADRYSPVGHSQWLADAIPKADLLLGHGRAHFGAVEELPRVLRWAAAGFD
jgi:pimeloyl-ACP methyl ester carboxylesterase